MLTDCFIPRIRPVEKHSLTPELDLPNPDTISCEIGILRNSKGSSFVSMCGTKLVCSVQGPRANQKSGTQFNDSGVLECEVRFTCFDENNLDTVNSSSHLTPRERYVSNFVKSSLESSLRLDLYPKSVISIQCIVLEEGEKSLSAAIISSSLALADAGIEQLDLVSSWALSGVNPLGSVHVTGETSTSSSFEAEQTPNIVIASMTELQQLTQISFDGRLFPADLNSKIQYCLAGCVIVRKVMSDSLKAKFIKSAARSGKVEP